MSDRIVVAKDTLEVAFGPTGDIQSITNETSGHEALIARLSAHPVELTLQLHKFCCVVAEKGVD